MRTCFRSLFYAEQADREMILQMILRECMKNYSSLCILCDFIMIVYFDGSVGIFEEDETVLKNRDKADLSLVKLLNTFMSMILSSNPSISMVLSSLWECRLNSQTCRIATTPYDYPIATLANHSLFDPLYQYECLQHLLEMVSMIMEFHE